MIRDEEDFAAHVDYIHYNPVKHRHAQRVADWPHSSFHRFVAEGILPADWAAGPEIDALDYEPEGTHPHYTYNIIATNASTY